MIYGFGSSGVCYTVCVKTGILLHTYYLEILGWEELAWGIPTKDKLGTLAKFADCLLDIPADEEAAAIIYDGPSNKDGMGEGYYTRQYLVDRIELLQEFPRLRQKIERLPPKEYEVFVERVRGLTVGHALRNTKQEIADGAIYFAEADIHKVLEIAAASHAPRCIKEQAVARENGLLPSDQQWFLVAGETCFASGSAADVLIREPAHRADDPLLGVHPSLSEVMERFQYELGKDQHVEAVRRFDEVVIELAAKRSPAEAVLETS